MTKTETAKVCAILGMAFPTLKWTKDSITMWHEMLKDLDGNEVFRAAEGWVATEEWNPTIAGIRRKVAEAQGILSPSAIEAWSEVQYAIQSHGHSSQPDWSNSAVRSAVGAIGYRTLCFSESPEILRAHFLKAYEQYKKDRDSEVVKRQNFDLRLPEISVGGIENPEQLLAITS